MCGFFGMVRTDGGELDEAVVAEAHQVQSHRGPDAVGTERFEVGDARVVLGHQRLSIIDLTDAGNQPMWSADGKAVLVFNGELYNYRELRRELEGLGQAFESDSDTEVLLNALRCWGVEPALERFNWMGAFAWLDRDAGSMWLVRDPAAEKPVYIWHAGPVLAFASELKTLLVLADRRFELDAGYVGRFVAQGLMDVDERSIFVGIRQLVGRSLCHVELSRELRSTTRRYRALPCDICPAEMESAAIFEQIERMFIDSVRLRLRSDVPVGVLLSGGIDSTAIAVAAAHLRRDDGPMPQMLAAVSEDPRYSEEVFVDIASAHLGLPVNKVVLESSPATFAREMEKAVWYNDVPITSASTLAHLRIMQRAESMGLKVLLSGQGADELLGGYRKYLGFYVQHLFVTGQRVRGIAVVAAFLLRRSIVNQFSFAEARRYLPFREGSAESPWGDFLKDFQRIPVGLEDEDFLQRQRRDVESLSVPALCHYEDRMSMAHSLEIRLPFLDPRLTDFLLRVPAALKLKAGWTKYCFREAMQAHLPPKICWRKDKQGFTNPEELWLREYLKSQVEDCFSRDSLLHRFGIIRSDRMLARYRRFCERRRGTAAVWSRDIFLPYSLELWLRQYQRWIE